MNSDRAAPPSSAPKWLDVNALTAEQLCEIHYYAEGFDARGDWHTCIPERMRDALAKRAVEAAAPPPEPTRYDFSGGKLPPLTDALVKDWHDQVGAAPAPPPPDALREVLAICERYWNEPHIGEPEIHAALENIHRLVRGNLGPSAPTPEGDQ